MSFERIQMEMKNILDYNKFLKLRHHYCDKAEKVYHEAKLLNFEIRLLEGIREFGPSSFIAMLLTSSSPLDRNQATEILRGRVTSDLFSDPNEDHWQANINILKEEYKSLTTRQEKLESLERQLAEG